MIKLLYKLSLFLPIILIIIIINYVIDPANLFKNGRYEYGIAKILVENENVCNIKNYDERLVQKYYIDMLSKRKGTVILGSSRVMVIGSNIFDNNVFNNSVSGASIEDDMGIYWLYRKKGLLPKRILVGLDPWLLNKNNKQERYKSIEQEYNEIESFFGKNIKSSKINNKIMQLISFTYFQESYKMMFSDFKNKKSPYFRTDKNEEKEAIRLNDGRIVYDSKIRNLQEKEVDIIASEYAEQNPIYSIGYFNEIDKELKNKFERFIDLLKKDGLEIIFILPPYHDIVYKKIQSDLKYKIVLGVENYFREYSNKNQIKIYGSYNPKLLKLNRSDFYDGMHQKESAVKKYMIGIK